MIDTWSSFLSEYLNSHTRVLLIRFWPETHIFSHNAILKHFFFFFIVDGISFKDSNLPTRMINKLINIYMCHDLFLYCIWTANECFTPTFSLLFVQSFTWSINFILSWYNSISFTPRFASLVRKQINNNKNNSYLVLPCSILYNMCTVWFQVLNFDTHLNYPVLSWLGCTYGWNMVNKIKSNLYY